MDFFLTSEQRLIQETARKIASQELAPNAAELDRDLSFPWPGIKKLAEAGLLGTFIPLEYGGGGTDALSFVLVTEELGKACASTAFSTGAHAAASRGILIAGTETQKEKYLPPLARGEKLGSFAVHEGNSGVIAAAIETSATLVGDHYIVNGSKIFNTNGGEAEVYLVLVRTDPSKGAQGISMLILERGTPGFSFGKVDSRLGLNGVSSRELIFQDCRVPRENLLGEEGKGLPLTVSIAAFAMLGAGAVSLGIAQAALEASIRHAKDRTISGQPIGVHQAIQFLIAEMSADVEAARSLLYTVAFKWDKAAIGSALDAFRAKLVTTEMAVAVTNKALQVHGGHGYTKDLPIERYFRDARGITLHFMTAEMLKGNIGKTLLGLS